ncbi:MAG TPA: D-alanine--D-alanine ligase [Spirochaetia bacterium]|nr:D-alanine--D-alanine ligase [Spirochaetia bacterium]
MDTRKLAAYAAFMSRRVKVGVVFGGRSAEHEVSLQSAKNVLEALDPAKYEPVLIGIDREGRWYRQQDTRLLFGASEPLPNLSVGGAAEVALVARGQDSSLLHLSSTGGSDALDVVFPVLHGPYGEDGSIQGLCKLANLPCVGAGILGSAVGMDKDVMKRLLRDAGIPTPRFLVLHKPKRSVDFRAATEALGSPVFVKPANLGSSVGVSMARSASEYEKAVATAFRYDTKIIIEERIVGREIECAVLGNEEPRASIAGEVRTGGGHDFYDYDAKYIDENGAELVIPAALDAATLHRVQDLAKRTFAVLCCEGMARVDMFLRDTGEALVNEINTIPGFTRISMYPKLWEATGLSYRDLVDTLIQLALDRHSAEHGLATTR